MTLPHPKLAVDVADIAPKGEASKRRRVAPLPRLRRWTLYVISAGTWLTGALWLIYHYYIKATDEFGFEGPHPLEHWWLIAHAAFGFWAAWMFGNLWQTHIKVGWRLKVRWVSGGSLFLLIAWLTISGYLLYYLGDQRAEAIVSLLHWVTGLAGIALFLYHMLSVRRRQK